MTNLKIHDIQIGNLYTIKNDSETDLVEIIGVRKGGIVLAEVVESGIEGTVNPENIIPIEITEDWLVILGFFLIDTHKWLKSKKKIKKLHYDMSSKELSLWGYNDESKGDVKVLLKSECKYVHQIQNIWRSIHSEIKINYDL